MDFASVVLQVVSGVGLFLLGMNLMTEGLKVMAGDSIRRGLMRFTRSPLSGIGTGVIGTAILQSSSATIIATVGFVGAGLLTFSQALGIILGANIGTTVTGWIIAIVGFKLKLGALAAVLIFIGALLRLFAGAKRGGLAYTIAGFGLIFIGIEALQSGLGDLQAHVDFSRVPGETLVGKLQLALIGILFTLIIQSSSAGVVAALASMHTGAIQLEQAAALVVGMNIGTTFTAAAATIGGNVHVRRTGFSHVVYNILVSTLALFLITPYLAVWEWRQPDGSYHHSELALVVFHSGFNILGVVLMYPFIRQFAHLLERLFPEQVTEQSQLLDPGLLKFPELALTAVQKALLVLQQKVLTQLSYLLGASPRAVPLADVKQSLEDLARYLDSIHLTGTAGGQWERLLAALHGIDHLERLRDRCNHDSVLVNLRNGAQLETARKILMRLVNVLLHMENLTAEQWQQTVVEITTQEQQLRQKILQQIAQGEMELKSGVALLDTARWLQRVSVHLQGIEQANRQLNYQQRAATQVAVTTTEAGVVQ